MAKNPNPSLLDAAQIIKRAFDEENDRIRIDAEINADVGDQEVIINAADDSIQAYIKDENGVAFSAANPLSVDGSGVTQPISASSLPLPTGAATSANQATANSSLSSIDTKLTSQATASNQTTANNTLSSIDIKLDDQATATKQDTGNTSLASIDTKTPDLVSGRVPVDGSGVTQPISASSLPLPSGASTAANQTTANTSLSSIDTKLSSQATASKQDTGNASLASIDSKIPSNPSQEHTTAGSPSSVRLSDGSSFYKATTPSDTQPISASSLPLPTGAATETTLSSLNGKVTAVDTGNVVVSSSALPTGAATSANQTTGNNSLSSIDTKLSSQATASKQDITNTHLETIAGTYRSASNALGVALSAGSSAAYGEFLFVSNPSIGDEVTFSSNTYEFIAGANDPVLFKVQIGATAADTAENFFDTISAGPYAVYIFTQPDATTVRITHLVPGSAGNSTTMSTDTAAVELGNIDGTGHMQGGSDAIATETTLQSILGQLTYGQDFDSSYMFSLPVVPPFSFIQKISASSLPLPSGAATAARQDTGNTSLSSIDTKTPALVSGRTPVDGSGVTQPVSAASLPLPTGAATAAKQPALGTAGSASSDVITVQGIASMTALKVDGSAVTQPVSGSVSVSNFPAVQPVSDNGGSLTVDGTVTANAGTGTFTVDGTVAATQSGTWTVQPGNTANTTPWLTRPSDGTNSAAIKAASTAAAASDPALVVSVSPNSLVYSGMYDGLFRGRASTFNTPGRAGTAGQKIQSIYNAAGSSVTVVVDKVVIDLLQTVVKAVTVPPPIIRLWKVTVAPTNGTSLTKNKLGGSSTSSASVTVLGDASSDGTGSGTTLTATLPAGTIITQEYAPRLITAAGYEMADRIEFMTDSEVELAAGEGLVLFLDYTLATQNPTTDRWISCIEWYER